MKKSLGAKTIVYPTPTWVVCTYDEAGKPNGMTAAWGGVACSQPPCIGVAMRKATYSYNCMMARRAFTVCVPSVKHTAEADFFGMASGRDMDKFAAAGLTAVRSELVDAPYIAEFPLVLECRLLHTLEIGLHTQFIGEIVDVKVDEAALSSDGIPDISAIAPLVYSPGPRTYHTLTPAVGMGFADGSKFMPKKG